MGYVARNPVFGGLQTLSAQPDQSLCYSLIGNPKVSYLDLL